MMSNGRWAEPKFSFGLVRLSVTTERLSVARFFTHFVLSVMSFDKDLTICHNVGVGTGMKFIRISPDKFTHEYETALSEIQTWIQESL